MRGYPGVWECITRHCQGCTLESQLEEEISPPQHSVSVCSRCTHARHLLCIAETFSYSFSEASMATRKRGQVRDSLLESLEAFSPYSRLQVLLMVTTRRVTSRLLASVSSIVSAIGQCEHISCAQSV
jgi:hypothetical protein